MSLHKHAEAMAVAQGHEPLVLLGSLVHPEGVDGVTGPFGKACNAKTLSLSLGFHWSPYNILAADEVCELPTNKTSTMNIITYSLPNLAMVSCS